MTYLRLQRCGVQGFSAGSSVRQLSGAVHGTHRVLRHFPRRRLRLSSSAAAARREEVATLKSAGASSDLLCRRRAALEMHGHASLTGELLLKVFISEAPGLGESGGIIKSLGGVSKARWVGDLGAKS